MRKHLYLITEHDHEDRVGLIEFADDRHGRVEKNKEGQVDFRNFESGETWSMLAVGLGYCDFDGEDDYQDRAAEVAKQKLQEIDDCHLEKAGVELEGVTA